MADMIDAAQAQQHNLIEDAIAKRRTNVASKVTYSHCIECGEAIPVPRQQAVIGCKTCIDCATLAERFALLNQQK